VFNKTLDNCIVQLFSERPPNNNIRIVNAQVSQHLVSFAEGDAISKPFSDHLEAPSADLDAPLTVPGKGIWGPKLLKSHSFHNPPFPSQMFDGKTNYRVLVCL